MGKIITYIHIPSYTIYNSNPVDPLIYIAQTRLYDSYPRDPITL